MTRSLVPILVLAIGCLRCTATFSTDEPPVLPPPPPPELVLHADVEFHDRLTPYGRWVESAQYGTVWVPNVALRRPESRRPRPPARRNHRATTLRPRCATNGRLLRERCRRRRVCPSDAAAPATAAACGAAATK